MNDVDKINSHISVASASLDELLDEKSILDKKIRDANDHLQNLREGLTSALNRELEELRG